MNASSVRPQTKFAAALVAAGVVSAAAITGVPENRSLPVLNIDVAKTSVITDALWGLGDAVNGVAVRPGNRCPTPRPRCRSMSRLPLPLAVQNPSIGPNLLSWLTAAVRQPVRSTIRGSRIRMRSRSVRSNRWPNCCCPRRSVTASSMGLKGSPTRSTMPFPVYRTRIPASSRWKHLRAPTSAAWSLPPTLPPPHRCGCSYNTAYYLGYLPANLEETLESAIQDPSEIPGLVSNLVYGLLSPTPDAGLLGDLLDDLPDPFTTLPGPIGQVATNVVTAIADGINNLLSLLPPPITPTPFPSAFKSAESPTCRRRTRCRIRRSRSVPSRC